MATKLRTKDIGLTSDSFVVADDETPISRVIANIEGAQKTGKNHFAFTAPDPIVIFNFDQGLEGTVEKFLRKGKRIIVAGMPGSQGKGRYPSYRFARPIPEGDEKRKSLGYLNRVKKMAMPIWEQWISDLDNFYRSEARTGIIDTGGAALALAKFAFHGMDKGRPDPKDDPYGQKSGDMKAIFQGLITDGYSYDKNVLWLHRLKDEWSGNAPTGNKICEGYAGMPYEVQVNLRMMKSKTRRDGTQSSVKVGDCRLARKWEGETFEAAEATFAEVMSQITGTEPEDWQ